MRAIGTPHGGAAVVVRGGNLLAERTGTTGVDGRVVMRALPTGALEVVVSLEGYVRVLHRDVVVGAGRTSGAVVVLKEGTLQEIVEVDGTEPLIDAVRTASQTTYDREYLDRGRVGVDARTWQGTLAATPVMVGLSVRGAGSTQENVYLLDGFDASDAVIGFAETPVPVLFDSLQEIQQQTRPARQPNCARRSIHPRR